MDLINDADSVLYHDCLETLDGDDASDGGVVPNQNSRDRGMIAIRTTTASDIESRTGLSTTATIRNRNAARNDNDTDDHRHGSSIPSAIFNFTNCIVGAGCIGLGGAMALSGGFVSVGLVLFFALLTKLSLDLLIRLSVQQSKLSYEELAQVALGGTGRIVVMVCKFSYSFGCLVAYIIVIKDNCGPALKSLIYGNDDGDFVTESDMESSIRIWFRHLLSRNAWFTWCVSAVFILPLCLLRDMTPLAFTSLVSVASMAMIVGIVIYIYFDCPDVRQPGGSFYENWVEVRPGVLDNLGTFVFTFVSQHTVHLVFASLKPRLQTVKSWKIVSSCSLLAATTVSLLVGVFVYITFWQQTKSDIFQIYPQSWMINAAKLLLCITMMLTFPLPFFTCRELLILTLIHPFCGIELTSSQDNDRNTVVDHNSDCDNDLERPLLEPYSGTNDNNINASGAISDASSIGTDISRRILQTATPKNWLLPHDDRQLQLAGHISLTVKMWLVATGFAIAAPSLGDILDLVGCASGTLIAFIIPALLSLRLEGYTNLAMLILVVGGVVGIFGTFYSVKQLAVDLRGR
jgi:amino acid permease